jgi:transposase
LGLNRDTVHKWLHEGRFPELRPRPQRTSQLDDHQMYLRQRWAEGARNARQLWAELRQRGYRGGYTRVAEGVARLRQEHGIPLRRGATGEQPQPKPTPLPSARQIKWLLLRPVAELTDEEYQLVQRLCAQSREVTLAYGLVMDFAAIVRQRAAEALASWVELAQASGVSEMASLARGVLRDFAAVLAALEQPWSQGPVEGHVNRLKCVKRAMYGRAKLDLLRLRVLYGH